MNAEYLVEAEAGEQLAAAFAAAHNVQMTMPELLQAQRDASHCSHERGIHHRAVLQVHDKFAMAAIHHLAREFFEVPAIEEVALAFHSHPNGVAVYSDLY